MKVSKQWLQEYLSFELPATDELVRAIGSQLGEVDGVTDLAPRYAGVLVAKVVECSKLENSDHLNLCFIDDGGAAQNVERRDDGLVQVVCGAPNVSAGVTVAWLPPGATVPSTYDHDPFVLEARALRGAVSNGMLASAKELAIGDSHEGLLLLDDDLVAGTSFGEAYQLNDQIIDIENKMFTHRPDCFGQLGVAREVAGILGSQFVSPEWYRAPQPIAAGSGLQVTVQNQAPADVPRLMAIAMSGVQVGPSPVWLQTRLSRVGVRPINNLVDITNYLMLLTGQPLHAYDYDKVAALSGDSGAVLLARTAESNEQLTLLSGKQIIPRDGALVIATDRQAIGLAGVMGGANTEVDSNTTNIIIECASFNMYSIRRTSMAHGLFTDAVTRFNKGQSPLQLPAVLAQAVALFTQLSGGTVASEVFDVGTAATPAPVTVSAGYINDRLGLQLPADAMATLLRNVECPVVVQDDELQVSAPFWRTDIEQPEDVVEEIGRLHGFDALPLQLPGRSITPVIADPLLAQKSRIRDSLVAAGANELLTYSFVHGATLAKANQPTEQAYALSNALSPDLQYYRYNALTSLLDKVHPNIKAGYGEFALFELSKGHSTAMVDDDGLPQEFELLDLVIAAKTAAADAAFYHARRYLDQLAADLGLELVYEPVSLELHGVAPASFDLSRTAQVSVVDGPVLGYVGEFSAAVRKAFKLPQNVAGFSIDRSSLLEATQMATLGYQPLPRFPKIEQDICLRTASAVPYQTLLDLVQDSLVAHKPDQTRSHVSLRDIYQAESETKQTTFRIGLASYVKTMTDAEMAQLLTTVAAAAAEGLGAERV